MQVTASVEVSEAQRCQNHGLYPEECLDSEQDVLEVMKVARDKQARGRATQTLWSSHHTAACSRSQTWSCRISCLSCWVMVLL